MIKLTLKTDALDIAEAFQKYRQNAIKNYKKELIKGFRELESRIKRDLFIRIESELRFIRSVRIDEEEQIVDLQAEDMEIINELGTKTKNLLMADEWKNSIEGETFVIKRGIGNNPILKFKMTESPSFEYDLDKISRLLGGQGITIVDSSVEPPRYYSTEGMDLRRYVKVVCSREIGTANLTQESVDRWSRDVAANNSATWALSKEGIDQIRLFGKDITPVVEEWKSGNYEEASKALDSVNKDGKLRNTRERVDRQIKNSPNVVRPFRALRDFVSALKFKKVSEVQSKTQFSITYSLQSGAGVDLDDIWEIMQEQYEDGDLTKELYERAEILIFKLQAIIETHRDLGERELMSRLNRGLNRALRTLEKATRGAKLK